MEDSVLIIRYIVDYALHLEKHVVWRVWYVIILIHNYFLLKFDDGRAWKTDDRSSVPSYDKPIRSGGVKQNKSHRIKRSHQINFVGVISRQNRGQKLQSWMIVRFPKLDDNIIICNEWAAAASLPPPGASPRDLQPSRQVHVELVPLVHEQRLSSTRVTGNFS